MKSQREVLKLADLTVKAIYIWLDDGELMEWDVVNGPSDSCFTLEWTSQGVATYTMEQK